MAGIFEPHRQRIQRVGLELVRGLRVLKGLGVYLPEHAINQLEAKIRLGTLPIFELQGSKNLGKSGRGSIAGQYVKSGGAEYIELPNLNNISDLVIMHEMVHQIRDKVPELTPLHKAEAYDAHAEEMDELATNWLAVHAAMVNGYDSHEITEFKKRQVYNPDRIETMMGGYMESRSGIMKRSFKDAVKVLDEFKRDRNVESTRLTVSRYREAYKELGKARKGIVKAKKVLDGKRNILKSPFYRGVIRTIEGDYSKTSSPFYPRDANKVISEVIKGHLDFGPRRVSTVAGKLKAMVNVSEKLFKNASVAKFAAARLVSEHPEFARRNPVNLLKGQRGLSGVREVLGHRVFRERRETRDAAFSHVLRGYPSVGRFIAKRKEEPLGFARKVLGAREKSLWKK